MARTRQRLALTVGSNYPRTSSALQGCVNDANDLHAWATAHGWDAGSPLLEPTDRQFTAAVAEHVSSLRYGDELLLTNSGHGTTLAALTSAEPDGLDEALVFRTDTGRLTAVRDDTLADLFSAVPFGARVIFVSDTCFSGGLQRDVPLTRPAVLNRAVDEHDGLTVPADRGRARYLPPDLLDGLDEPTRMRAVAARDTGLAVKPRPSRVALLSGCDADELSYDALWTDGRWRGALTATLLDVLGHLNMPGRPTLRTIHTAIRQGLPDVDGLPGTTALPSDRYPQSPRLDASYWQRTRWTL